MKNRGGNWSLLAGSLALASCASAPEQVQVRPIADPGSKLRLGDGLLADAKGQLALGNVGLAIEGFRKASREHPDSAEAFAGLAACYDAMGRYDLAQSNYEAALAIAPRNTTLLTALAASFERQGNRDAAAEVRNEVALMAAASAALDQTAAEVEPTPTELKSAQTLTVSLPPPQVGATAEVAISSPGRVERLTGPALAATTIQLPAPAPEPREIPAARLAAPAPESREIPAARLVAREAEVREVPAARLPAPRLSEQAKVDLQVAAPRLERLSLGEVALVTGVSAWRGQVVTRSKQSVTVRWVPLNMASARPNIRLLNAARRQGLAANTRQYLLGRGWRKIEIGNSKDIRDESVVLYPAGRPGIGRSLAAQFGFRARAVDKGDVFVVLLGRDAARSAQRRG